MKFIKILSLVVTLFVMITPLHAQNDWNLKTGSMIYGIFLGTEKYYTAEITASKKEIIQCRFSHSGSLYTFKLTDADLNNSEEPLVNVSSIVVSSIGGAYKAGTAFNFLLLEITAEKTNYLKVNFGSKAYIAKILSENDQQYEVEFLHSGNKYTLSKNGVVLQSSGMYKKGTSYKAVFLKYL